MKKSVLILLVVGLFIIASVNVSASPSSNNAVITGVCYYEYCAWNSASIGRIERWGLGWIYGESSTESSYAGDPVEETGTVGSSNFGASGSDTGTWSAWWKVPDWTYLSSYDAFLMADGYIVVYDGRNYSTLWGDTDKACLFPGTYCKEEI